MFNEQDLEQINARGIAPAELERQVECFRNGFPPLDITATATVGNGIVRMTPLQAEKYRSAYQQQAPRLDILKFVPASGAATRMFKDLFVFMEEYPGSGLSFDEFIATKKLESVRAFFERIRDFAFYDELAVAYASSGNDLEKRLAEGDYADIVRKVLLPEGLGYGSLPKGLIAFHRYGEKARKAAEEQLAEGVMYATGASRRVRIHFTVSPEHEALFDALMRTVSPHIERDHHVSVESTFSTQSPATDTIAVDMDNVPVRDTQGRLIFRPGGHGALIDNLNRISADVVFIKNIDNVVPDRLKENTVLYKQVLAGYLLELQADIHKYLRAFDLENPDEYLEHIEDFVQYSLCHMLPESYRALDKEGKRAYLRSVMNRPLRVCGMVKNEGEPGGGPFWVHGAAGEKTLQIVESAQIDLSDDEKRAVFESSTHFNPVDLVCATKDYNGHPFDLHAYVDPQTGFISKKSIEGRDIKALERPGLWNGAMSRWITVFVEVPADTFNPVKTVNDLLRPAHQND